MKSRRTLALILFISYILTLMPLGSIITKSKAASGDGTIVYYNSETTPIYNKYDIRGVVSEDGISQYNDCLIITSSYALYVIRQGTAKPYKYIDEGYSYKYAGRYGNDVFLMAKKNGAESFDKRLLKINISSGSMSWEDYSSYLKDSELYAFIIDGRGNKWFGVESSYRLIFIKLDANGNLSGNINTPYFSGSGFQISRVYCDTANRIWFTVYMEGNDKKYHTDSVTSLNVIKDNTVTRKINSFGTIKNFTILDNGEIWYIPQYYGERLSYKNYVAHLDQDGKLIKQYDVTGADSIDTDGRGNIWLLDAKGVKQLLNDKFVDRYEAPDYMSKLFVDASGNIAVFGENEFMLVYGGKVEKFRVDSFVRNNAYVTKDNQGILRIVSRDNYKYYDLMTTTFNSDWTLLSKRVSIYSPPENKDQNQVTEDTESINSRYETSYKTAEAYDDDIFVYAGDNELYRINNGKSWLYSKLEGKVFGVETREVNGKLKIYAICKEIKEDDNGIIIIFLTSLGGDDDTATTNTNSTTPVPVPTGQENDNKKYYELVKMLMDKNGDLYLDVRDLKTGKKHLFRKIDGVENAYEDPFYLKRSSAYESILLNENGEIEYIMNYNNTREIWMVDSIQSQTLKKDARFDSQDAKLNEKFGSIKKLVRGYDNVLYMQVDNKIYTRKESETKFTLNETISSANSIVTDRNGFVFIGTDGQGVVAYVPQYFQYYSDMLNPGVTYLNVAKDSKNVAVDSALDIYFNENLKEGENFTKISLKDRFGNGVAGKMYLNGSMITIVPDKLLDRSSIYTVTIPKGAVRDMKDNPLDTDLVFTFTTVGEKVPPSIIKAEVDKKAQRIIITFSEDIEKGSSYGKITFTEVNGRGVRFTTTIKGRVLTIASADKLIYNMKYKLNIPAECVMDLEGNRMIKGFDLYFKYE